MLGFFGFWVAKLCCPSPFSKTEQNQKLMVVGCQILQKLHLLLYNISVNRETVINTYIHLVKYTF